jgi:protein O-GlcNAc transferase
MTRRQGQRPLRAGLPVLTCPGAAFAGRIAASLRGAVGLPELVTASLGEYEALALALTQDPARLAGLKAKLARQSASYPLFDIGRFTRSIEAAYTTMWRRYQSGQAPASFAVEPPANPTPA